MARTWLEISPTFPESKFDEGSKNEPASPQIHYDFRRNGDRVLLSMADDLQTPVTVPVQHMIGGQRHGISFLLKVDELGGASLERPAMIEARYALLHTGALALSPGFPKGQPQDLEHALGRVLSPGFEVRCLMCHGQPGTLGAGEHGGVRCESCHGPASAHVASPTLRRPTSLKGNHSMEVCAQCHSGFKVTGHADPLPEDLLISSQVSALRQSECFIQSGQQLTCTACHNPHQDSEAVPQLSNSVCLSCHSLSAARHAAICPLNQTQGCTGCHMPSVQVDSFRVTDHWIRAQSDVASEHRTHDPAYRSQIIPKREFLRLIAVATDEEMKAVTDRLAKGESFSSVARELSKDQTAPAGGFIGGVALADMDPGLAAAAAQLEEDSNSVVIRVGDRRLILHRLSRDFKWKADRLYREALNLNENGDRALAIQRAKQALDAYPYQLKGLILSGVLLRQTGDISRALAFLGFAAQLYPQDAATQFNLAMAQNSPNRIEQLRHVIELDPDILVAYQTLGASLDATGEHAAAIDTYRAGLKIDPLSAVLYHDLGLALKEQGDAREGANALALAARIDPKLASVSGR